LQRALAPEAQHTTKLPVFTNTLEVMQKKALNKALKKKQNSVEIPSK
jgi:hypothetical protein